MNVLIIGGTGILSTAVCNLALERGMSVTTLNRGKRKEFVDPRAKNIISDVRNNSVEEIRQMIGNVKYDVVIDFISYNLNQLEKTLSVIDGKCKQFIFISSATVYSEVEKSHEFVETDDIHNKKWDYCKKKAECEDYLNNSTWTFEYTIIRPYVTYGKTRIPFQIIPLKYYTLLNRINNGKPILFADMNALCTLTNVNDFSVGVVGLFKNPKAYGESFHITSNYRYSWRQVYEIITKNYGKTSSTIEIPLDYLSSIKDLGFELDELYGDKARNMIFNNSKIKNAVVEFKGDTSFEEGIKSSLLFFEKKEHQNIDYVWEGRIDRIINIYAKERRLTIQSSLADNKEVIGFKDRMMYMIGRYEILYAIAKFVRGKH